MAVREEYENGWRLPEIFPVNVLGFQTHRDHFAIGMTVADVEERLKDLSNLAMDDEVVANKYNLLDNRDWSLSIVSHGVV